MSTLVCLPPTGITSNLSSWVLWGIWTTRNLIIFENRAIPATKAMERATSSAREWLLAQTTSATSHPSTSMSSDLPPISAEVIRCNTDAAWSVAKRAGLGWCFESSDRQAYLEGLKMIDHVSSPLMAEALAMRDALQEAQHKSFSKVWFRTDSQELVRAIDSKIYSVELFGVFMDIELLSSSFDFIVVSFISRTLNGVADSLAKFALHSSISAL